MISYLRSTLQKPNITEQDKLQPGTWVRVEKPTDKDIGTVIDLGLDTDIVNDTLDPYEVPRIDHDGDWACLIARLPDTEDEFGFTTPILFAIGKSCIVTVSQDPLGKLWKPFIEQTTVPTTQKTKLFMAMIGAINTQYERHVATINRRVRAITRDVQNMHAKDIAVFTENERRLNDYLDALVPLNMALEKLLGSKLVKLFEDDKDMVEDLSIDFEQLIVRCKSQLRTITNLRDSYRAVMDTRLNETLRILTVITVVLTIPTMVAGVYGMNVDLPGDINAPGTFWVILGLSALASVVLGIYFLRKR
ncbi:MAG: magnesium transporter CorA family protein [Candidatus Nomurabacteria bacterium]|jgi:magnesium transporter|nr:magnesium transporter CorA family protein [Candidatus Nomurabacteria bacterium]